MALPFLRRPGKGGFLNGVSGVINSLVLKAGKSGKTAKDGNWTMYSGVVNFTPDGADKATQQFLDGGFLYGDLAIKDGKIVGKDPYYLDGTSQLGKFVVSLVDGEGNRAPEELVMQGEGRNYDAIAGIRVTLSRIEDAEKTKRVGRRKDEATGKDYPQDHIIVQEVLALPAVKAAKGGKATKATAAVATTAAPTNDALATLKTLLEDNGGTLAVSTIGSTVTRFAVKAKMDTPTRQALVKTLSDEAFLASAVEAGAIAIEGEGKDRTLLAA